MTTKIEQFNLSQQKTDLPDIRPGDTVKVHQKIKEGNKERIQIFEGVVIAKKHGKGIPCTITVRKVVEGIGVERIFPIHSPALNKIEIVKHGKVKRAKLYYLRTTKGKRAKIKAKEFATAIAEEPVEEPIIEELATTENSEETITNTITEEGKETK